MSQTTAQLISGTTAQDLTLNSVTAASVSGAMVATTTDVAGVQTTGTNTAGSNQLTVASAANIVAGMYIVGEGIPVGTTVNTIVGTTVTMSQASAAAPNVGLNADPVGFYTNTRVLTPGNTAAQLCRAWVNFNGTGVVAIRTAYNVSSITDNGVGDYTVNFTTAMPDVNYCAISSSRTSSGTAIGCMSAVTYNTGSVRVFASGEISSGGLNYVGANFNTDHNIANVAIFR